MTFNLRRYIYSFIFFSHLLCGSTWAQVPLTDYKFVNIKEGLSKVAVSTIIQDHYGFIWIGNSTGLYKYDGIEYTSYKSALNDSTTVSSTPAVSNSTVNCAFLDSKKRLWVGTSEGLDYYIRDMDCFKRIKIFETKDVDHGSLPVLSLSEDNSGNIFIGSIANGLFKLNSESFELTKVLNSEDKIIHVLSIQKDKSGKIYAGTNDGLKEYDEEKNILKQALFYSSQGVEAITEPIQSLLIDDVNNHFWIGTWRNGLIKVESQGTLKTGLKRFPITNKLIRSIILLPDSTLMCGTENDGLIHINENGTVLNNYLADKTDINSIRSNSIWSMLLDNKQRIWMGYYNSGIAVYDKLYDKFNDFKSIGNNENSLQSNSVTGISQDESGKIWISMDGGGIDVYNPENNKFTHVNSEKSPYKNLTSLDIQTVFIDSKQNVWAGSWNDGIFLLKKGTKTFIHINKENSKGQLPSNGILSFSEDSKNTIWIGTFSEGILSYDTKSGKLTHHKSEQFVKLGIHKMNIKKVLVDSNDNIWIGTPGGLFKINRRDDNSFSVVSMVGKMTNKNLNYSDSNHIYSIYESSDGSLWIGTRGAGLCKYDVNTDEFLWYNLIFDHKLENVNGIIESLDGNIWLTGYSGVSMLNVKTNTITSYNKNDGLLSNDFNFNAAFRDKSGKVYFGNYKGVDYFEPDHIRLNTREPTLYLTGFKLFNEKVLPSQKDSPLKKVISETDKIILNYDQSVFSIEYSGINYTRPEKNQYAFYLDGLEETWNYVGNVRSATYTNLNPGDYIFKLKSANNDGVWNSEPLNLKITILPPWWKTNWALFLYFFLFVLGLYLLNRLTLKRISEKQEISNEIEKRIQKEELNERKLRFFTNISHEFRTPLTLIINPLEDILQKKNLNLSNFVQEKHQIIHKNANRLSRLINELMDFRKLELNMVSVKARSLELISFVKDIASYFNEEALYKNIYLNIDTNDSKLNIWADPGMLEKIVFNILSNAFKVTPDGGSITIDVSKKSRLEILPLVNDKTPISVFEISIRDTGPGLKKEQLDKIFERFYQVDKLNSSYFGGTGIGLEVVRSFVELHKGKIEVESEIDLGTVFRITLPVGNEHFSEDEIVSFDPVSNNLLRDKLVRPEIVESIPDEIVADKPTETKTLLIVEDNTELLSYLKKELSHEYKVLTANNGKKGLELAQKGIPDIIITDVIMPEMNGFDLCVSIKNDLRISHIPVLMLTTKTMTDDWVEGIESGADAYMSKPFNLRILKSRLTQLTSNRQLLFNKYFSAISDVSENTSTTSLDKEFIQKVLNYINDNIDDPELSVDSMASQLSLSRSHFYRKIKTLTGNSANGFLRKIRLQRAKIIIEQGNANITDVCYNVGFSTPSYFTKCFKNEFGILPTEVKGKS